MNEAALLRAVSDDPADDAPRLILSDWYDENGRSRRAEFIRTQVDLAGLPARHVRKEPVGLHDEGDGYWVTAAAGMPAAGERVDVVPYLGDNRRGKTKHGLRVVKFIDDGYNVVLREDAGSVPWPGEDLRRREAELLPYQPLPIISLTKMGAVCVVSRADGCPVKITPPREARLFEVVYRRGFWEAVSCHQQDFFDNAALLFTHPITSVTLTDRRPLRPTAYSRGVVPYYCWYGHPPGLDDLPSSVDGRLYDLLPLSDVRGLSFALFFGESRARAALSWACVRHGREAAGCRVRDVLPWNAAEREAHENSRAGG